MIKMIVAGDSVGNQYCLIVDIFMKARKIIESAIIIVGSTNVAIYTITSILHMTLPSVFSQRIETVVINNLND